MTYIVDDLVVVVLEESFTRGEKRSASAASGRRFSTSAAASSGDDGQLCQRRRAGDRTQRQGVLSETDIEQDVSVETFLLADERTEMTGLEDA
jgi:hypothetical protein